MDRSIYNPTIPRAANASRTHANFGFKPDKKKGKRVVDSIKNNFEQPDSDEEEVKFVDPGPGQYLTQYHTSYIGKKAILHDYPQNFGTVVQRFQETPVGCHLGPG